MEGMGDMRIQPEDFRVRGGRCFKGIGIHAMGFKEAFAAVPVLECAHDPFQGVTECAPQGPSLIGRESDMVFGFR